MSGAPYDPYNPLDKQSIADSLARVMLSQPCDLLPPPTPFYGAGVYVIYYKGDFPAYEYIARRNSGDNCDLPIYVGKAVPRGGRIGIVVDPAATSQTLYSRLIEHADSIRAASETLRLEHFRCRYRVIEELFIELAERTLIQTYKPLWNAYLGGFGNHDPGSGRYNGKRSGWDEVHPGRAWAGKLRESAKTRDDWLMGIRGYLAAVERGALGEVTIVDDEGETEESTE